MGGGGETGCQAWHHRILSSPWQLDTGNGSPDNKTSHGESYQGFDEPFKILTVDQSDDLQTPVTQTKEQTIRQTDLLAPHIAVDLQALGSPKSGHITRRKTTNEAQYHAADTGGQSGKALRKTRRKNR